MAAVHPFIPRAERDDGAALPDELQVALPELQDQPAEMFDGARIAPLADGTIDIGLDGSAPEAPSDPNAVSDHYANLAEHVRSTALATLATEVIDMVKADIESREIWYERLARGMELLGVMNERNVAPPFDGASTVTHPLVAEAIVQYQARALVELWPAAGPAKTTVMGDRTRQKEEQAERVEDYMNYQLAFEDESYYAESDRLLFLQASEGSVFRKVYHDDLLNKNVPRLIRAGDFIVPYSATTLEDAPRYTHRLFYSQNEMKRLQASGFFAKVDLAEPMTTDDQANRTLDEARDENEGRTDTGDLRPQDREYCIYETVLDYDLPGFEDPDGIALPYVVSVEISTPKVLAIRRQWKEGDPLKARRIQIVHYPFIRGDGFYGYGLYHLAGGLGKAATGLLRLILDNGAFAALQGGFKSKDAKLPTNVQLSPGRWNETEMTAEELAKCFYTPPFKDVPTALFQTLGLLTDLGQRFVNTTDATVGDARNTGPVGTTVALIEQGQKVATGVHKRSHEALGRELRILAELNGEHLPSDQGYPYDVPGASRMIFAQDFGPEVDVLPVSDPNIFSSTQRIAIAQAVLQTSEAHPEIVNPKVSLRRFFEAMKVPDIDELLPPDKDVPRCDPVTENARAMTGQPIKVFPDQAHDAHIAVHYGQLQMISAQPSASADTFHQVIIPHIQEHEAESMRLKMMQQIGIPLPPLNGNDDADEDDPQQQGQQMDPRLENEIAMRAAQVMQALTQQLQQSQAQAQAAPAQADQQQAQQDQQQAQAEFTADQQRKDAATQMDEKRKDMKMAAEIDRQDAMKGMDPTLVKAAAQFLQERGLTRVIQPRKLAQASQLFEKSFEDTVKLLMFARAAGQNAGPAPFSRPTLGGYPVQ